MVMERLRLLRPYRRQLLTDRRWRWDVLIALAVAAEVLPLWRLWEWAT